MSKLRPTIWRTCRVLACATRLKLLWVLFEGKSLSVGELGREIGMSESNASIQLRALNARGLITPHRKGMELFYRAEVNEEVGHAAEILAALRVCYQKKVSLESVIHMATAFTHPRRIQLVRALAGGVKKRSVLQEETGMVSRTVSRHLNKLVARQVVERDHLVYRVLGSRHPLGRCLVDVVCEGVGDFSGETEGDSLEILRVISGGQTGADRAALDAALACEIPHGGWCPRGRRAEDGVIPSRYVLRESSSTHYPVRTKANVAAADLTVIFSHGPLTGGSLLTQRLAQELRNPCVHVDLLRETEAFRALDQLSDLFPKFGPIILNVAGPRASTDPMIYQAVYDQLVSWLK